jgi:hypothetical protein
MANGGNYVITSVMICTLRLISSGCLKFAGRISRVRKEKIANKISSGKIHGNSPLSQPVMDNFEVDLKVSGL